MKCPYKLFETTLTLKGLKAEIQKIAGTLDYLRMIKSYHKERTGIIGGEERETILLSLFGGGYKLRDEETFQEKLTKFIAKYSGTEITMAMYPELKKEVNEIFHAHVFITDERRTPEQDLQHKAEMNKIHAEQKELQRVRAEKREHDKQVVRKEYPYLMTAEANTNLSDRILATKNIRIELDKAFPGQRFSITSDTFSMGDSIDVKWEDGPTEKEVSEITRKYQEGHFDGMNDMYEYGDRVFNSVYGGAKYVHASRTINKERWIEVGKELGYTVTFEDYKMFVVDEKGETGGYDGIISNTLRERSFYEKPENPTQGGETTINEISSASGITIQENKEKQGIEIKFPGKPEPEILSKLKMNGFRWNRRTKVWYKKMSKNAQIFAESLIDKNESTNSQEEETNEEGLITQEYQAFENELIRESQMEENERF